MSLNFLMVHPSFLGKVICGNGLNLLNRILNDQKCDDDCSDARSESRYLSSLIGVLTEASACDAHPTGSSGRATKVNVSIDVGYIIKIQLSDSSLH